MIKQALVILSSALVVVFLFSVFLSAWLYDRRNSLETEKQDNIMREEKLLITKLPLYLDEAQKSQLVSEISHCFVLSEKVIFQYWGDETFERRQFDSIILDDPVALQLFSKTFDLGSNVSHSQGFPGGPVFMNIKFMPSGRSLIFELGVTENVRFVCPEEADDYGGIVSFDFVLFSQYYFGEIIDRYGEHNMVDKAQLYTNPENQNEYIETKLAEFSRVIPPLNCPDEAER